MKFVDYYWDHPSLQSYVREIPKGRYLFRQGERGTTMFIIIKGIVELRSERGGKERVIGFMEAGQFLGEKAILQELPHQRVFSARATSDLRIVEIGLLEIDKIQKVHPEIMTDILKTSFQIAAKRLEWSNRLIAVL